SSATCPSRRAQRRARAGVARATVSSSPPTSTSTSLIGWLIRARPCAKTNEVDPISLALGTRELHRLAYAASALRRTEVCDGRRRGGCFRYPDAAGGVHADWTVGADRQPSVEWARRLERQIARHW